MSRWLSADCYLGETRTRREVAGLALTETVHRQPTRLPQHTHAATYFCLVLSGEFEERVGGKVHEARPGTLLFHPAGESHVDEIRSPQTSLLNIALGNAWERRLTQLDSRFRPHPGRQGALAARLAGRIAQEFAARDPAADLVIEGLVLTLLAETSRWSARPSDRAPRWLPVALDFIHAHFRQRCDHDALARVAGVHPTHFARAFRVHVGCTVGEYVRGLRIEWARKRLTGADVPLAAVALDAGFADQAHFTRWFRRETGTTPAAYRRRRRSRA